MRKELFSKNIVTANTALSWRRNITTCPHLGQVWQNHLLFLTLYYLLLRWQWQMFLFQVRGIISTNQDKCPILIASEARGHVAGTKRHAWMLSNIFILSFCFILDSLRSIFKQKDIKSENGQILVFGMRQFGSYY